MDIVKTDTHTSELAFVTKFEFSKYKIYCSSPNEISLWHILFPTNHVRKSPVTIKVIFSNTAYLMFKIYHYLSTTCVHVYGDVYGDKYTHYFYLLKGEKFTKSLLPWRMF